jgi:hypothetical protein
VLPQRVTVSGVNGGHILPILASAALSSVCILCPGVSTSPAGSNSEKKCKKICPAGKYGATPIAQIV